MTKCLTAYRQKLGAQTAITEIRFIHPDAAFDLRASVLLHRRCFSHVKLCSLLSCMSLFASVVVSFELKIMCGEIRTSIAWLPGSPI